MNFEQSVLKCIANYSIFSGRATRSEYWYWRLFVWTGFLFTMTIDSFIIVFFDGIIVGDLTVAEWKFAIVTWMFWVITILPDLAVSVRRLHDINKSGWWLLIGLTGIGILLILFWAIQPSSEEGNTYG